MYDLSVSTDFHLKYYWNQKRKIISILFLKPPLIPGHDLLNR